ncbi:restriction endonuclease subunit S [Methylosinus sp. KRF6]|uniref:restriction endonuclease subunit S n=1 Tax=Methylosinus sp. KRF6 TaxID=2846853 RepID=UPI0035302EFB
MPLYQLCAINIGRTPRRDEPKFWSGSNPWASIRDLAQGTVFSTREYISNEAVGSAMPAPAEAGTLLVSFKLTIGRVAVAARKMHHNEAIASLPLKRADLVDRDYLRHVLPRIMAGEQANDAVLGRVLNKSKLERLQIPLPSLDEQRRIVELLDRAAEIRRRTEAARAKTRSIIAALFLDTFGDPLTNPKRWRRVALGDVILEGPQNGLYRPASDYGDGVRILRIDSFDDGMMVPQDELKRLRIDAGTAEKFGLRRDDIVINRVNSPSHLGKSVLIPDLAEPVVFESNMMRFRVDSSILLPQVVGSMLQLDSVRRGLIKNAKHAINQSSINQGDVRAVEIFAPPLPLQELFVEQVCRLRTIALSLDGAAATADAMAASLSAEIFDA